MAEEEQRSQAGSDSELESAVDAASKPPVWRRVVDAVLRRKKEQKVEHKDPLYTLTWRYPRVTGTPPPPRQGATLTTMGETLVLFGGSNDGKLLGSLYVFHMDNWRWEARSSTGMGPSARQRHTATQLNAHTIVVWGGMVDGAQGDGDTALYLLDTVHWVWRVQKVVEGSDVPPARWGHSCVRRRSDNTLLFLGGHDGKKALNELWELDTHNWRWAQLKPKTDFPSIGARHTATNVPGGDAVVVLGGTSSGRFDAVHEWQHLQYRWEEVSQEEADPPLACPPPRTRHRAWFNEGNVYVFGGAGGGRAMCDLWAWGVTRHQWRRPKTNGPTPKARMDHAVCVYHGPRGLQVFIFGGNDGQTALNDIVVLQTMSWSEVGEVLVADEPVGGTRSALAAPPPRIGHTVTLVGTQMFVVGGASGGMPSNDIRIFDIPKHRWILPVIRGTPPRALVAHTTCLAGGELFVFGGGDGVLEGNSLFVFDVATNTWDEPQSAGDLPVARYGHTACIQGMDMYVFGGFSSESGYSNTLCRLDITTLSWERLAPHGSPPCPRVGHSMTLVASAIFVFGGSGEKEDDSDLPDVRVKGVYNDLHVLDVTTMTWTQPAESANVPMPRFAHSASLQGTKLIIYGGIVPRKSVRKALRDGTLALAYVRGHWRHHRTDFAVDDIFMLDINTLSWEQPLVSGSNAGARFRHTAVGFGTAMFVLGGHGGGPNVWQLEIGIHVQPPSERVQTMQLRAIGSETPIFDFLLSLNMHKQTPAFVRAGVDNWDKMYALTDEDLVKMGFAALGRRKKLLAAIQDELDRVSRVPPKHKLALFLTRYRVDYDHKSDDAAVFRATDTKTNRDVMLALVPSAAEFDRLKQVLVAARSAHVIEFLDEHTNIGRRDLRILRSDALMGWKVAQCFVLEAHTISLQQHMELNNPSTNERRHILEQLAQIVEQFHKAKIALCDIHPRSFMLFEHKWKLVDFAAARPFGTVLSPETMPTYCSPERAQAMLAIPQGRISPDRLTAQPALDIWCLGCLFVETFSLQPFARLADRGLKLSTNGAKVPSDVDNDQARHLLQKMLNRDPLKRANILAVQRHAYLVGGLDTEQFAFAFSHLGNTQQTLKSVLVEAQLELQQQHKMEVKLEKDLAARHGKTK